MTKALLFIAAVLMFASMIAQTRTTYINEHLDSSSAPSGWNVMGAGTNNWGISATQNAGGAANELVLVWSPQFNGTSRMVMPAVDLTGVSSVVVSFKHALDNYTGSHTLGIATSSDGGTTWNEGWSQSYASSSSWSVTQNITTTDMGHSDVLFCLFYTGNSYNINNWYFDDIEIFSMENHDLSLVSIDVVSVLESSTIDIKATVQNKGLEAIDSFTLAYQLNDMEMVEETFNESLASLATKQVTFSTPVYLAPGSYELTVGSLEEDDDPSNNIVSKTINVALGNTQRVVMIEHFSSSTCGPCVSVNTGMSNLTNQAQNQGKFTYTKYQMNWPGNGDPYYTEEGGVRRQFYGVNAVPNVCLEGTNLGATTMTQAQLDNAYNTPSFADVRGSFNVDGNNITVKVDFMAYYDMTVEKAFVTVNEKETHNNVGTNGETSFHHVFMKFLTSPSGDALNIPAGEYQHFEWTQNMTGTHVEEMNDLEVSAWIQNIASHEVMNSHFMYEYTDIHPYPVRDFVIEEAENGVSLTWNDPEGGNAVAYNVYLNGELLAENLTETQYNYPCEYGYYVFEVEALYENDMTSVKMVKDVDYKDHTAVAENKENVYSIYPNPTDGNFTVAGADMTRVEVYNLVGQKVYEAQGKTVTVDASNWNKGIYMINIIDQNGSIKTQKLMVK
jgi:hypothetical protein